MKNKRLIFFILLISAGAGLSIIFSTAAVSQPYGPSLSPVFQMMGIYTKSADRFISRMVPVDNLDEKEFGEALTKRFETDTDTTSREYYYLNQLIFTLSLYSEKPFEYRVFLLEAEEPNAFALPGGVILISTGLLDVLETEGELVAVLAHEMGHIELSHCFDMVRFELLDKKKGSVGWGPFTDSVIYFFANYSFSKTMEEEADRYSYDLLLLTDYDPFSEASALSALRDYSAEVPPGKTPDPVRDYFSSHPPLELRIAEYENRAEQWRRLNSGTVKYRGKKNLEFREPFNQRDFGEEEWVVY